MRFPLPCPCMDHGESPGRFPVLPRIAELCWTLEFAVAQLMKMLFFSADDLEVDQVSRELLHAGIPCEVRGGSPAGNGSPERELWVQDDRDCHRAFMVCVELGIGFAKRPSAPVEVD